MFMGIFKVEIWGLLLSFSEFRSRVSIGHRGATDNVALSSLSVHNASK